MRLVDVYSTPNKRKIRKRRCSLLFCLCQLQGSYGRMNLIRPHGGSFRFFPNSLSQSCRRKDTILAVLASPIQINYTRLTPPSKYQTRCSHSFSQSLSAVIQTKAVLKGLSHEMDLAVDEMYKYGQFKAQIGDGAFFKFCRCSRDFITQKVLSRGLSILSMCSSLMPRPLS